MLPGSTGGLAGGPPPLRLASPTPTSLWRGDLDPLAAFSVPVLIVGAGARKKSHWITEIEREKMLGAAKGDFF